MICNSKLILMMEKKVRDDLEDQDSDLNIKPRKLPAMLMSGTIMVLQVIVV